MVFISFAHAWLPLISRLRNACPDFGAAWIPSMATGGGAALRRAHVAWLVRACPSGRCCVAWLFLSGFMQARSDIVFFCILNFVFSKKKRRLRGDIIYLFPYICSASEEGGGAPPPDPRFARRRAADVGQWLSGWISGVFLHENLAKICIRGMSENVLILVALPLRVPA